MKQIYYNNTIYRGVIERYGRVSSWREGGAFVQHARYLVLGVPVSLQRYAYRNVNLTEEKCSEIYFTYLKFATSIESYDALLDGQNYF